MGTLHWGGVGGGLAKPGSYICIFTCIYVYIYIYTYTHIARIDVHNSGQGAKKLEILRRGFGKKATPSYRSIPRFQKKRFTRMAVTKMELEAMACLFLVVDEMSSRFWGEIIMDSGICSISALNNIMRRAPN